MGRRRCRRGRDGGGGCWRGRMMLLTFFCAARSFFAQAELPSTVPV